jgi:hypothetical protein
MDNKRKRSRYSAHQASIVDVESQKIIELCKGNKVPSKSVSEWYHPPHTSHRSLIPDPKDDYSLSIFFWRPEKFYNHYVPTIPCVTDNCYGNPKSKGWVDGGARLIYGLNRNVLLRSWSYKCDKCNTTFYAHDEKVLKKLPEHVRLCKLHICY